MISGLLTVLLSGAAARSQADTVVASAAQPETLPARPKPRVVRVGYTTFNFAASKSEQDNLRVVDGYLGMVAQKSKDVPSLKVPLDFELAFGNYYQILSWFKTGQIDAAIVSPFMAMLLERDSQALSILEFSEGSGIPTEAGDSQDIAAHYPWIVASGRWRDDPITGFDQYLSSLLVAVRKGEPDAPAVRKEIEKIRAEFRVDLVAHLSTSGFIMPALYVENWLDQGKIDKVERSRFWRLYFENAHLTLMHGALPAEDASSTITFSYHPPDSARFGSPMHYRAGRLPEDSPSIPNDVLLVRRQLVEEVAGGEVVDRASLGNVFLAPEIQKNMGTRGGRYKSVLWYNPATHDRFRAEVSRLFSHDATQDPELARLNTRWYENGLFDFTIDETMAFLRQDQENSRTARLALVLSGGGVKSLYQTVLLDELYGAGRKSSRQLRNPEIPTGQAETIPKNSTDPLIVHTIIGTSGGAMLAFFAAQLPQVGSLRKIVESTSGKPLFPMADFPRLLSIFVLLFVMQLVFLGAKTFNWWGYGACPPDSVQKAGSWRVLAIALLIVVAGAVAIVTTRSEYMETVPAAEGVFYILTCILAHFCMTCVIRESKHESPTDVARLLGRLAAVGLLFGVQLLGIALVARHWLRGLPEGLHRVPLPGLSVLASAGVFVIAAALATGALSGRWGLAVRGDHSYVAAMAAAATVIGAAFLPLVAATATGYGSMLELTGPYWSGLIGAGVVASVALLFFAHAPRRRVPCFLRGGLDGLMRDRRGVVTTSLAGTMVGLFAFCIACWVLLVAPAVYSNVRAVRAFGEALSEDQLWTGSFQANLVVTGTLLRATQCSSARTINAGGLYFCFEGQEGCGTPTGGPWQVFRKPAPARALDAVFASGSAFPVFPPHLARLPDGCEVHLVDGGYAHNIPLEAASMSDARQVLILNASPDPLDDAVPPPGGFRHALQQAQLEGGQLFRSSPEVLSFLFSRAQELDRNIGGNLVVASLTPRSENGWWPGLLDFRPSVREELVRIASQDINQERRIGHVLSWGRPVMHPLEVPVGPTLEEADREPGK